MFGNGISGISVNVLKAFLTAVIPKSENKLFYVALIFFIISGLYMILCGYAYGPMNRSPYFQYVMDKNKKEAEKKTRKKVEKIK